MTTPPNPFAQPDKGERFTPRDHPEWLGKLFIIRPNRLTSVTFDQEKGPQDVIEAYVAIVDLIDPQTGQPKVMANTSIAGKGLVPQLKSRVGEMVLGRLMQTPPQGQKSGTYMLSMEQSTADIQAGMSYIAAVPIPEVNAFAAPQAQAPAPQPQYDMWQHTQAAPAPAPQAPAQGFPQAQQQFPAPAPQGFPQPAPQAAPVGPDPVAAQRAFLNQRGILADGMAPDQVKMIASTFPDAPQG